MSEGFDRLRPRTLDEEPDTANRPDVHGKRALFSGTSAAPSFGAVTVECSRCGQESVLTPARWLRAALPSLHLPLVKRHHSSWMRCPACGTRTWVSVRFRV